MFDQPLKGVEILLILYKIYSSKESTRGENSSTSYPVINIFQLAALLIVILVLKFKINIGFQILCQFFKFTKISKFCCCCCCFDLGIAVARQYIQNITLIINLNINFLAIAVAVSGHFF